MSKLARYKGLLEVGVQTTVVRLRDRSQSSLSVLAVAVAVGVMLTVGSIAAGIAMGGVAADSSADYLLRPSGEAESVVASVETQSLGDVHETTARIESIHGVEWATPLLTTPVAVSQGGQAEYVVTIGVIPDEGTDVGGLSTAGLTPGDPMFETGSRTGEAVISRAAAEKLGYSVGDEFQVTTGATEAERTFTVVAVAESSDSGIGQRPVVIVHLRELQAITGSSDVDAAGQILVSGNGPRVEQRLAAAAPTAEVTSRSELLREQLLDSGLTLAVGVGAFLIAVVVSVLFIVTTVGFELAAERADRLVMQAIGVSRGSRTAVVVVHTSLVCVLGGLGGVVLWAAGTTAMNAVATTVSDGTAIAVVQPWFALGGLLAALLIGVLAVPMLLIGTSRDGKVVP